MSTVAVSKLKASLSAYLRRVQRGEEVTITDHGRPIAQISPLREAPEGVSEHLKELARQGKARLGTGKLPKDFWTRPFPADPEGSLLKAILEEREEGP